MKITVLIKLGKARLVAAIDASSELALAFDLDPELHAVALNDFPMPQ